MDDKAFLERLSQYPPLKERFSRMIDIIENSAGDASLADDAEECIIQESRQMNKEILASWADNQSTKRASEFESRHQTVVKSGKKKSPGTAPSEI